MSPHAKHAYQQADFPGFFIEKYLTMGNALVIIWQTEHILLLCQWK